MSRGARASSAASATLYVGRAQLKEWFAGAAAGAQRIYARGPMLDHRHEVSQMVTDWQASSEVHLKQSRDRDSQTGGTVYWVERRRPNARAESSGRPGRVTVSDEWRETPEGRIFMMLVRAANLPLPCPSNAALADFARLPDADAARYLMRAKLAEPWLIQIENAGVGNAARRVKIIETGRWTAWSRPVAQEGVGA